MLRNLIEDWLQFAIAAYRDIDAPCETIWDAINDVESFPSIFADVTAVEYLGDSKAGERIRIGSKHRVHRRNERGQELYGDWTVTELSIVPSSDANSSKFLVTYFSNDLALGMTASTTWVVEPIESEGLKRSRVTITLAIVPHKIAVVVGRLTCCCIFRRLALSATERDLDGLADFCDRKVDARGR